MATARKCVGCFIRPVPKDGSRERCKPCEAEKLSAEKEAKAKLAQKRGADPSKLNKYTQLYYWKKHLIGVDNGKDPNLAIATEQPIYIRTRFVFIGFYEPEDVPARAWDLNGWCEGLHRPWVNAFKAYVKKAQPLSDGRCLGWDGSI